MIRRDPKQWYADLWKHDGEKRGEVKQNRRG